MESIFLNESILLKILCYCHPTTIIKLYPYYKTFLESKFVIKTLSSFHNITFSENRKSDIFVASDQNINKNVPTLPEYIFEYYLRYDRKAALICPKKQLIIAIENNDLKRVKEIIIENGFKNIIYEENISMTLGYYENEEIIKFLNSKSLMTDYIGFIKGKALKGKLLDEIVHMNSNIKDIPLDMLIIILEFYARGGHLERIKELIKFRPTIIAESKLAIVEGACKCGNPEMIDFVINLGFNYEDIVSGLLRAGNFEVAKKYWCDSMLSDIMMSNAIYGGCLSAVLWLEKMGLKIYTNDHRTQTLHAINNGYIDVVLHIIQTSFTDRTLKYTALKQSAINGHFELIDKLTTIINFHPGEFKRALELAEKNKHGHVVILLKRKIKSNSK